MRVFRGFDNLPKFRGAVATLGSFDGLHRGHLTLLDSMKRIARASGGESVVLTFEPHPRVVLGRADGLRLLTSTEEKIMLLERYNIDNLIIIPFDRVLSRVTHRDFVREYMVERVGISTLVAGYNHHFGRGSEGAYDDFLKMGNEFGFDICRVEEWRDSNNANVSSTVVRHLISIGDIAQANELLSRNYLIMGHTDSDGRVWVSDSLKLLPPSGEYQALINGQESQFRVDANGVVWCDEMNSDVVIEVQARINS
ncbi:MAG: FAD synthetase [Rikenellaceae bacterium]